MRPIKLLETVNPEATSLLVNERATLKEVQDYINKVTETLTNLGFVKKFKFRIDCVVSGDDWISIEFFANPYEDDDVGMINFLSFYYLGKKIDSYLLLASMPKEVKELREHKEFASIEQAIYAAIRNMPDRFID